MPQSVFLYWMTQHDQQFGETEEKKKKKNKGHGGVV